MPTCILRHTLGRIHINAAIVTNRNSIEKLEHCNYCGVMPTRILGHILESIHINAAIVTNRNSIENLMIVLCILDTG